MHVAGDCLKGGGETGFFFRLGKSENLSFRRDMR